MSIDISVSSPFSQNGHKPVAIHSIYLALGSNMGDRRGNLAAALQRLREVVEISAISSIYETEPVGYLDQPRFFNIVCYGNTALSAHELLKYAKDIEVAIGRQPTFRNGPRPIDIDIIFYDDLHIIQDDLTIPHPRMAERAFVLAPLAEITPDAVDPVTGHTAQELLKTVSQEGVKKLASDLRISLDRDIQSGQPTVHVRLGRAGVVSVTKAILIGNEGNQQWFNATFDLYADLDSTQAGVHMSRFSDALDEVMEGIDTNAWPKIEMLAEHIAKTIVERQKAFRADMIGVEVEGMVACPCAQDMVHSFARVRLQEEGFPEDVIEKMLSITPLATHNQRGRATLMIGTDANLDASDLIDIAESAMSSENYGLLKRPDELYIVNKAHANPRFVEDVAREILRAVVEKYTDLPDDAFVWVRQRNEETIHKYDVEAEGWGTLGELRAEILNNARIERHTTKEEWLGLMGSAR